MLSHALFPGVVVGVSGRGPGFESARVEITGVVDTARPSSSSPPDFCECRGVTVPSAAESSVLLVALNVPMRGKFAASARKVVVWGFAVLPMFAA